MNTVTRVQNLHQAVYILYSIKALEKGMNQIILPLGKGKIVGQDVLFNLGIPTAFGEEKLRILTC